MSAAYIDQWLRLVKHLIQFLPQQEACKKLIEFLVQSAQASRGEILYKNQEEQIREPFSKETQGQIERVFVSSQPLFDLDPVQSFYPILDGRGQTNGVLCLFRDSPNNMPFVQQDKDITLLAHHFLKEFAPQIPGFQPELLEFFQSHLWPGNVRELKHYIERMILCHEGKGPLSLPAKSLFSSNKRNDSTPSSNNQPGKTLDEIIKKSVCQALLKNNFNKSRAAKELGIFRDRLDRLIQKYSLQSA